MSKTIMIVDDSSTMRRALSMALRDAGYTVVEAEDGRQALALLDGRELHLIVSDVRMPNLDGLSFARAIRERVAYRLTPLMMLTTENDLAAVQAGKAAGVRAWILKPFLPATLLAAVSKLVVA